MAEAVPLIDQPINPSASPSPLDPSPLAAAAPSGDVRSEFSAARWSLVIGIALLAVKFAAYFLTSSAAIFSDALESIVNVLASALTVYAIGLAHAPADSDHPYGHGKVEFITAAFEGGMLAAAAIVIFVRALESLHFGSPVQKIDIGAALMLLAMLVNGYLGWFLYRRGRLSGSIALEGSGHHLLSDAVTSIGVLIALMLVKFTHLRWFDPLAGMIVAIYAGVVAANLMRRSFAGLMDEQDHADDRKLRELLDRHVTPAGASNTRRDETHNDRLPTVCSYHKLRHRHSGRFHWVDFHLVVPADWTIDQGHRVASRIELEIEQNLGDAIATAHVEPCNGIACPSCPRVPLEEMNVKRRPVA
jgi:cation diffusion facilitator family transporter